MDIAQFLPLAVFGGFTFAAWSLLSWLGSKESVAAKRLDELRSPQNRKKGETGGGKAKASGGMGQMMEKAAPSISKMLEPKTELEQNALKIKLANAGFTSPNAGPIYLAIKVACMGAGFFLGGGIGYFTFGATRNGLFSIIIGVGFGMYLPSIILWFLIRARQEKIFLSLPDALDLLVVCVEAGLGLDAGMRRVADELNDSAPELCKEFQTCNFQLQIGRPRREVLHDLGVRSGVDDLKALAAILIQADRFGASIAQALRVQSDAMRVKRSQMAEEKAAQTAVKMIFPLVLFIFPGIFVVLVGPAAISMMNNLMKD